MGSSASVREPDTGPTSKTLRQSNKSDIKPPVEHDNKISSSNLNKDDPNGNLADSYNENTRKQPNKRKVKFTEHETYDDSPLIAIPKESHELNIDEHSGTKIIEDEKQEELEKRKAEELEEEQRHARRRKIQQIEHQMKALKRSSDKDGEPMEFDDIQSYTHALNELGLHAGVKLTPPEQIHEKQRLYQHKQSLLYRLSQIAGARLKVNNPDIAELSDPNRATKLAENLSELYDNEWTDLFELMRSKAGPEVTDRDIVTCLRDVLHICYMHCASLATHQREHLYRTVTMDPGITMDKSSPYLRIRVRELQTDTTGFTLTHTQKIIKEALKEYTTGKGKQRVQNVNVELIGKLFRGKLQHPTLQSYIDHSVEVSWLTQIQDPPVVMEFTSSDVSLYRLYTASGNMIDYVIWPTLLLHVGGALLSKGVAQFKMDENITSVTKNKNGSRSQASTFNNYSNIEQALPSSIAGTSDWEH